MTATPARPERSPDEAGPTISVCMIVRNEAQNLAACLAPLAPWAHEIIVVDTGSTDGTPDLAKSLGAAVLHFKWIDDFAAARNASIRPATGEWVFWLDADDRLDPEALTGLSAVAASGGADAYLCNVRSTVYGGADELTEHIRLFRNRAGITFVGRIHETVMPSLVTRGLKLSHSNVEVRHTGYAEKGTVTAKATRNLAIVEAAYKAQPNSLDLLFYRCQSLFSLDRRSETRPGLERFLRATCGQALHDTRRIWAYGMLLRVVDEAGETDTFERTLAAAMQGFPTQPYFLALRARLDAKSGKPEVGLRRFNEAVNNLAHARGFAPSPAWLAQTQSECYLGVRDYEAARQAAREALVYDARSPKALCLLVTADLLEGKLQQAEVALTPLLSGHDVEPWITLYDLRTRQERFAEAEAAVDQAAARGLDANRSRLFRTQLKAAMVDAERRRGGPLQRGIDLLAGEDFLAAAECFGEAIEAAPTNPQGYRYLAAALQKLGAAEQAAEAWQLANHWQTLAQPAGSSIER
jgi:tetratricopeptide (TPR) repeat protein